MVTGVTGVTGVWVDSAFRLEWVLRWTARLASCGTISPERPGKGPPPFLWNPPLRKVLVLDKVIRNLQVFRMRAICRKKGTCDASNAFDAS